jgi:hypothetical protein
MGRLWSLVQSRNARLYIIHCQRRLVRAQGRSGRVRKISPSARFDPRTVQPVESPYTDYTIPSHTTYFLHLGSPYIFIFIVSFCFLWWILQSLKRPQATSIVDVKASRNRTGLGLHNIVYPQYEQLNVIKASTFVSVCMVTMGPRVTSAIERNFYTLPPPTPRHVLFCYDININLFILLTSLSSGVSTYTCTNRVLQTLCCG